MAQPSLLFRLWILLLCGQIIGTLILGVVSYSNYVRGALTDQERGWSLYGLHFAQQLVVKSLVRAENGSMRVQPTEELRAYLERAPRFRYGAFDLNSGEALPGSSPELASSLRIKSGISPTQLGFELEIEPARKVFGFAAPIETPMGAYLIATCGFRTSWEELLQDFFLFEGNIAEYYLPTLFVSIVLSWIALKHGLSPLKGAADQARRIDMRSLDQRISVDKIPAEIVPLIATINDALARLDEDLSRQTRFLANAAHELRTPVMILSARANGIEKPTFRKEVQRDARRIRNIVEQLLASARLGKTESTLNEDVNLSHLVPSIVDDHALLAIKNSRRLEFDGDEDSIVVWGDRQALESVVANLVDNALRAEPEGGVVLVRVLKGATIEVVDHGEGVGECDREVIFEPFWRKNGTTPGTGLGLAIAKELVEKHRGRIWVEDTPGGGATFKIRIPSA
jgi:signal transduction histidine kinase